MLKGCKIKISFGIGTHFPYFFDILKKREPNARGDVGLLGGWMGTTLGHIVVQGKGVFLYGYSITRNRRFGDREKIKRKLKMCCFGKRNVFFYMDKICPISLGNGACYFFSLCYNGTIADEADSQSK